MKAIILNEFGGVDVLNIATVADPVPGAGEVLIKIHAAGVNPVDAKIRKGLLLKRVPHAFPVIPGWDAAGVVERIGEGVSRFQPGDEVYAYCRKPIVQYGAYAEYIVLPESSVAMKPRSLLFPEAASIPLAGLTAWQSLMKVAQMKRGHHVLIHAGAGGVGGFAIQIAKDAGAYVIATASAKNHDYVGSLGADEIIDYTTMDFVAAVRKTHPDGLDIAFDTVGGDVQSRSALVLKKGGALMSILQYQDEESLKRLGVRTLYHFVEPSKEDLCVLARMVDDGKLKTHLSAVLPLEDAAEAHRRIETQRTVGKIVLKVEK
ncbi:MAG TPA: NADP-dependent oxidoreductase [Kiritimatiellia bacterium]|nr:NADP-dependent oxidoreductase [Kiritimatiellia bacterium]